MVIVSLLNSQQQTQLRQWQFADETQITVGRAADNHVVVDNILVSRRHLEISLVSAAQQSWRLHSLGTNGTFLNGKLVSSAILADGSTIQLGHKGPTLKFELQEASAIAPQAAKQCDHAGNPASNLFCIQCGQPLQVLYTLRDYQILKVLGKGGMGTTFLVWSKAAADQQSGLQVLKEMNADMAEVPKAQELFEREARILQSLRHPQIPQFFDYFIEAQKKYLVMELVHGHDLDQWVMKWGPLRVEQAIAWMLQTCEVLDYLHHQNPPVIHRDLKPSNLIVRTVDQQIVIVDFGAVKEAGTTQETRIAIEGYSAPEQNVGRPQIASDLYAVGATLIFLLTGENPFKFYKNQGQGYRFHLADVTAIPATLRQVIERATEPKVSDRYPTAQALAAALRHCL